MGNLRRLKRGLWGGKRKTPRRIVLRFWTQALRALAGRKKRA
jgi:hypothetical protein